VSDNRSTEHRVSQSEPEEQQVGLLNQQSEAILSLQRQLKAEQRTMRQLKSAKSNYLLERGELEEFFLDCIENVRKDVLRRRLKANPSTREVKLEQFTESDKRKVIELLVSDERVLLMVHDRIFPTSKPSSAAFTPSKMLPSRSYSHLTRQSHGLSTHKLSEVYAGSPFFTVQRSQRPSTAPRLFKK
jgi:superfamily I DNA and/or RNA helicase